MVSFNRDRRLIMSSSGLMSIPIMDPLYRWYIWHLAEMRQQAHVKLLVDVPVLYADSDWRGHFYTFLSIQVKEIFDSNFSNSVIQNDWYEVLYCSYWLL